MALRTLPNAALGIGAGAWAKADVLAQADADRLRRCQAHLDFYNEKQWERKRPGLANLVLNYCRAVVDKGVSYLLGEGVNFAVPEEEEEGRGDGETRGGGCPHPDPLPEGEGGPRADGGETHLPRL